MTLHHLKALLWRSLAFCSLAILFSPAAAAEEAAARADARRRAFEIANAFANDGFILRDGFFAGQLQPGRPALLRVQLLSANIYRFSAATSLSESQITLRVLDQTGREVGLDHFSQPGKAAVAAAPAATGMHFIQVRLTSGPSCDFALLYSYK